ncbi:MAG: hypothetical protein KY392_05470, partial [Chloroflexi bacterium]|nr:hypothetical protein [Chloroflexota bacterium]
MPSKTASNQSHLSTKSDTMRGVIHIESHAEDHPMHAARRRTLTILVMIGLSLLWAAAAFAVGTVPARAGSGHVVHIENFAYAPAELTIE